jgi:hypothetical protein
MAFRLQMGRNSFPTPTPVPTAVDKDKGCHLESLLEECVYRTRYTMVIALV